MRADVNPRARSHLAVHHQAFAIELIEAVEGRPVRHQIGVRNQHPRRVFVGAESADRFAGLHAQRLISLKRPESRDDAVIAFPIARGAADAAINHKLLRLLGDLGVEVVHQHPQRCLGQPDFCGKVWAARGTDVAGIVETG